MFQVGPAGAPYTAMAVAAMSKVGIPIIAANGSCSALPFTFAVRVVTWTALHW
jgi:hypothetical protein